MRYDFDVICIGLGPAGMAVSVMASEMGLTVCAIEKNKIGGECMNTGCIPSKGLLRMAHLRGGLRRLPEHELGAVAEPAIGGIFKKIQRDITFINDHKTRKMLKSVELILGQGSARFTAPHTVEAGGRTITGRRIFICTGTKTVIPPIPGIADIPVLTNENVFLLERVPSSMIIIGGGATGCELAQAFALLGSTVSIVHMDDHLIPIAESDAGALIEDVFTKQGITVLNKRHIARVEKTTMGVRLITAEGETLEAQKLLVAAGKHFVPDDLGLTTAGIAYTPKGITVNHHLQTTRPHIYAAGDCNGHIMLSHAAMHQGMLALMNSMLPWPFKMNFRSYPIPWTIFTQPEISQVGLCGKSLAKKGVPHEVVESKYADYGAAIAENSTTGFLRAFMSTTGRIYGAVIVGEGSGEMINEWTLAIQHKLRITDIMLTAHSFPTMGFLTKRVSESWMMNKMRLPLVQKLCQWAFRL